MTDSNEEALELFRQHRSGQLQYTYFLLAAVGAGMALIVNQTKDMSLTWSQLPLLFAVLCWAASFYCGARQLQLLDSATYKNILLLQPQKWLKKNLEKVAEADPEQFREAFKELIERDTDLASTASRLQFLDLVIGAMFYLGWHVLEMFLRTSG